MYVCVEYFVFVVGEFCMYLGYIMYDVFGVVGRC